MNTPVNSKIAKLLKEKKFNEPCLLYWKDLNLEGHRFKDWNNETIGDSPMHKRNAGYYSAPTIAQVVMWLLKNHHIWVYIQPQTLIGLNKDRKADNWYYTIIHCDRVNSNYYGSPTEAYEAAIEYALNTLI